ncbi:EAL domain-containing protein [Kyrpidia tusciae]|uniref:Diguanylate phosphodiesterase n=1 Tax=Kyrpidia tusciae (strain DSM 2912 / NBRC 15312 / T2) TaxID=562970 RepID=D5WVL0_KYRT2|nr:EAL domain-containing protein [Kyrpidia tusciae]ADG07553.1 diguanylate phosphodiesterase [Kyrpidia tusciae DSM 2912]
MEINSSPLGGYNYPLDKKITNPFAFSAFFNQYKLHSEFQPVVYLSTGEIYGVEALTCPSLNGKPLDPQQWFRSAWERGLSADADLKALETALSTLHNAPSKIKISNIFVNVMASSLNDSRFITELCNQLHKHRIKSDELIIEIVEYVEFNPGEIKEMVKQLRSLGIRVAIDDCKTLDKTRKTLIELEPDFVKMDKSIIGHIHDSYFKQTTLVRVVEFIQGCGKVIAEGVERAEEREVIHKCGVEMGQGYLWAPPLSIEELAPMLQV